MCPKQMDDPITPPEFDATSLCFCVELPSFGAVRFSNPEGIAVPDRGPDRSQ
jgi:hypothetical protein